MIWRSLLSLSLALLLTGCVTLSETDRSLLQQRRVSPDLYSRMSHRERISIADILELSERKVPASFVLRYLRSTGAVYKLSSDDVLLLRRSGVDRTVIDYLLQTPALYGPRYVDDPFWYYDDPYWWDTPPLITRGHVHLHGGGHRHHGHGHHRGHHRRHR